MLKFCIFDRIPHYFFVRSVFRITKVIQPRTMSGEQKHGLPLKTVVDELLGFASTSLAESWDNVGLLVEPVDKILISRILLTNDLTEDVMDEALSTGTNLIISYHPPVFAPLKKLTSSTWKERIISQCLRNNIALFSPHTSWDVVKGGVNDWLASAFEFTDIKPLNQERKLSKAYYILTVCEPKFEKFESEFSPTELQLLHEQEVGLNLKKRVFRCSEKILKKVISLNKFLEAGCIGGVKYYYVTPEHRVANSVGGVGRICTLKNRLSIREAVEKLKKHIGVPYLQLALARGTTSENFVETVAFVAGSGGSLLKGVKCDLKITGEASHHEVLDSVHNGSSVILTNHSNSERGFLYQFKQLLAQKLNCQDVQIDVSNVDSDPLKVV